MKITKELFTKVLNHEDTVANPQTLLEPIEKLEVKLDIIFPESYKQFMQQHNGGLFGLARIFSINYKSDNWAMEFEEYLKTMGQYIEGTKEKKVLPFANDWGGSYFCFDLSKSDKGEYEVLLWNHEYAEEPDDKPYLWTKYASHFPEFLEKIVS